MKLFLSLCFASSFLLVNNEPQKEEVSIAQCTIQLTVYDLLSMVKGNPKQVEGVLIKAKPNDGGSWKNKGRTDDTTGITFIVEIDEGGELLYRFMAQKVGYETITKLLFLGQYVDSVVPIQYLILKEGDEEELAEMIRADIDNGYYLEAIDKINILEDAYSKVDVSMRFSEISQLKLVAENQLENEEENQPEELAFLSINEPLSNETKIQDVITNSGNTIDITQSILPKSQEYTSLQAKVVARKVRLDEAEKALRELRELMEQSELSERDFYRSSIISSQLEYYEIENEYLSALLELETFRDDVLRLVKAFEEVPLDSERLRLAKTLLDEGKPLEANRVLSTAQMEGETEQLLREGNVSGQEVLNNDSLLNIKASEWLIKAQITKTRYEMTAWYDSTEYYFRRSLQCQTNAENQFAYALFLQENNQVDSAIAYYLFAYSSFVKSGDMLKVAATQHNLGNLYLYLNDYQRAKTAFIGSLTIYQQLAKDNPNTYEPDVATTQNNLGILYRKQNDYLCAGTAFNEALKIRNRLAQTIPSIFQRDIATTQNNLGVLYRDQSDYQRAEVNFNAALAVFQRLAQVNPTTFGRDVATTQNNLGILYFDQSDYLRAEAAYGEALTIYQRLAQINPASFEADVATTQNNLGLLYSVQNDYLRAETAYREALAIYQRLNEDNPVIYDHYVATTQNNLGNLHSAQNDYLRAEAAYGEALTIYQRLAQTNPTSFEADLATTQNNLGILYFDQSDYRRAEAAYSEALIIYQRLAQNNPASFEADVATTQNNLGLLYSAQNDYLRAEAAYSEALVIYQRLAEVNPTTVERDIATIHNNLGLLYLDQNEYQYAEIAFAKALEIYQRLAQTNPAFFKQEVATIQNNLGLLYSAQNDYLRAEAAHSEAFTIYQQLAQYQPRVFEMEVARSSVLIALLKQQKDQSYEALLLFRQALQITDKYPELPLANTISNFVLKSIGQETADLILWDWYQRSIKLEELVYAQENEANRAAPQEKVVDNLEQAFAERPNSPRIRTYLSIQLGNLSWYYIFARNFTGAETVARRGLEIDESQTWINSNLVIALVFQGRFEEAKPIYVQLKDQPYDENRMWTTIFLEDLFTLENAGITHPDVRLVRQLLAE